jgi:hypothetical protein
MNILTVHSETLTQYITLKRGGKGESVLCSLLSYNCDVLHRRLLADSDKILEGGTSTVPVHILHPSDI